MCELLAMSSSVETDITISFNNLSKRGGLLGPHKDGWGITFYQDLGCRTFKDVSPCYQSYIADLIKNYPIQSKTILCHIRLANRGRVALENTHPFSRELWGKEWTFIHNGELSDYTDALKSRRFLPIGTTDSEMAFCFLMDKLYLQFESWYDNENDIKALFCYLAEHAISIQKYGIFNIILSQGDYLFALCGSKLHYTSYNGQEDLSDNDVSIHMVKEKGNKVVVVATEPLTDKTIWHSLKVGEWLLLKHGQLISSNTHVYL